MDEALSLLLVIQGKRILPSQEHLMFLKEYNVGNFLVKSLYKVLDILEMSLSCIGLFGNIGYPSKVGFFAWEAA